MEKRDARLTNANINETLNQKQYTVKYGLGSQYSAEQKLGQLEDIEDELGIDLRLLPKLLQIKKNDKLYCDDGEIVEVEVTDNALVNGNLIVFTKYAKSGICYTPVLFYRDYGKEWALTIEELKK